MHPRAQLETRGLRPKHSFGQNFLADESHLAAIAEEVRFCTPAGGYALELGAGTGVLTHGLLERGLQVTAVERDRDLVPLLQERFVAEIEAGRLKLLEANAVTVPYAEGLPVPGALCGNLPYHLTSSLLLRAAAERASLTGVVFLVQLEVAQRIASDPGSKAFGVLSVLLQHPFEVELVRKVPRGAFWPVPEVDGGVLRMRPRQEPLGGAVDERALQRVVKAAFAKRRKTLRNALAPLGEPVELLEAAGIDPGARAETVPVEAFAALTRAWLAREGAVPDEPEEPEGAPDA
jgi:16S rRNA (adenine1518-N6/adenine1519-N6)-dimethyltransferase